MAQVVSQLLLPLVLALTMLVMGLGLKSEGFVRVFSYPKAVSIGFAMQCLVLPLLALTIVVILPVSFEVKAGIFLVSLCPGGATSNLFTYLARGDLALSVTLTTLTSLLSPFTLPIFFASFISLFASVDSIGTVPSISNFPVLVTIKQLLIITLLPTLVGMLIALKFPDWAQAIGKKLKPVAAIAMITIIVALIATNYHAIIQIHSITIIAILLLVVLAMSLSGLVANKIGISCEEKRALVLEVGIQNAGTAILVALTIMNNASLALVPLVYGLLMNIPAISFLVICLKQDSHRWKDSESETV